MSLRASAGLPAHLLGRHVAERSRGRRRARCRRSRSAGRECAADGSFGESSFARPKSRILTRPSFVTKTFSGFRSRWTMPFSCAAARPCGDLRWRSPRLRRGGKRPPASSRAQRLAFEQLLHDVRRAVVLTDVVDRRDVRVVEDAGGFRLLLEAAQPVRVLREGRRQHLDRDLASEPRILRPIHLAHAPGADLAAGSRRGRASSRPRGSLHLHAFDDEELRGGPRVAVGVGCLRPRR